MIGLKKDRVNYMCFLQVTRAGCLDSCWEPVLWRCSRCLIWSSITHSESAGKSQRKTRWTLESLLITKNVTRRKANVKCRHVQLWNPITGPFAEVDGVCVQCMWSKKKVEIYSGALGQPGLIHVSPGWYIVSHCITPKLLNMKHLTTDCDQCLWHDKLMWLPHDRR